MGKIIDYDKYINDSSLRKHEPVDSSFFDEAKHKFFFSKEIRVDSKKIFQYLKVAENWPRWHFLTYVEWTTPYFRVGTRRNIVINDKYIAKEFFFEWEENKKFAFYFTESNFPFAKSLAERFSIVDLGGGKSRVEWIVAFRFGRVLNLLPSSVMSFFVRGNRVFLENLKNILEDEK